MKSILALAALLAAARAFSQTVVYDNTVTYSHDGMPWLTNARTESSEMGDEVILAGAAREVVEFRVRIWYAGTVPGTFDMRLRFRGLDKEHVITGPAVVKEGKIIGYKNTPTPGQVFYDGPIVTGLKVEPGMNEYTFAIPHVKVPDRFVWTVQGFNRQGTNGNFGPAYYDPPAIGSSQDFFWQSEYGSPWIAYSWGAEPVCNFGVKILAVGAKADEPKRVVPPR